MPFLRDRLLGSDARSYLLGVGVALSMILGGTDVQAPWLDVAVETITALIAWWWFAHVPRAQIAAIPRAAWVIVALIVTVPLVQLIPLPPGVWHALPGRDLERQALDLVGQGDSWRALSVVPDRTFAAMLSMICAAIYVPMIAATDTSGRTRVIVAIVVVAALSVLVGTQQVTGDTGNIFQFYRNDLRIISGFQRNRNSEADVLLIAMAGTAACAAVLLGRLGRAPRRRAVLVMTAGVSLVFACAVVLTGSRTGIVLIVPMMIVEGAILFRYSPRRLSLLWVPVAIAVAVALVWNNPVVQNALDHFRDGMAVRPLIWDKMWKLLPTYIGAGSGLGSFSTVFATVETVDMINPNYFGHAFNDYAQLALETGVSGLVALALIAVPVLRGAWQRLSSPAGGSRPHAVFALASLVLLALHSGWDYPLRSPSLACVAACCAGMLLSRRRQGEV